MMRRRSFGFGSRDRMLLENPSVCWRNGKSLGFGENNTFLVHQKGCVVLVTQKRSVLIEKLNHCIAIDQAQFILF